MQSAIARRGIGVLSGLALALAVFAAISYSHGPKADVRTNAASPNIQSETAVAAFQQCLASGARDTADVVLSAYNDPRGTGISLDRSTDGGATFTQHLGSALPQRLISDPALAIGKSIGGSPSTSPCGNAGDPLPNPPRAFLSFIYDATGRQTYHAGYSSSDDGGQTWSAATDVSPGLGAGQDKPWIAVDRGTNTPYVCWTDTGFPDPEKAIRVTGGTYSNFRLSAPKRGADNCNVQVDLRLRQFYVVWYEDPGPGSRPAILFRRCDIPGPHCDPILTVSGQVIPIGSTPRAAANNQPPPNPCGGTRPSIKGVPNGLGIETSVSPVLTVDGADAKGRPVFLVAWNGAQDKTPGASSDIWIKRSTNGGTTWAGVPRRVNTVAAGDQFMPALTAIPPTSPGFQKLQWYDRREDPGNSKMRLWGASSGDGGLSWKEQPISDVLFDPVPAGVLDPNAARKCYMGDYTGIFAAHMLDPANPTQGRVVHFLHTWGDNRAGNPDVFFDLQEDPPPPPPGVLSVGTPPSFSVAPDGPSGLHPADILDPQPSGPPQVGISCAHLGLTATGCDNGGDGTIDDVVGISYGDDFGANPDPLAEFSVAPGSHGASGTGVEDESICNPPQPQADVFGAPLDRSNLRVFDGDGNVCFFNAAPGLGLIEPDTNNPGSDDLDALHPEPTSSVATSGVPTRPVYFTLGASSPSLASLGFTTAHILKTTGGSAPTAFATPAQLGLRAGDKIADLCLRDSGNTTFDASDLIAFSLAPGSPTLSSIGATPSDVLSRNPELPLGRRPIVALSHALLGLQASDQLDALGCDFPGLTDIGITASPPSTSSGTVGGGAVPVEVSLQLLDKGPQATTGDVSLWVDAPSQVTASWVVAAGDECVGVKGIEDSETAAEPDDACSTNPVIGIGFQPDMPVGLTPSTRTLNLTCRAAGTFKVVVRSGIAALDPPGARDLRPANDSSNRTITLTCS